MTQVDGEPLLKAKTYSKEEKAHFAKIRAKYGAPVRPEIDSQGKINISSVPAGSTFWATPQSGPLAHRHVLVARMPDNRAAIVGGAGVVPPTKETDPETGKERQVGGRGSEYLHFASKMGDKKEKQPPTPEELEAVAHHARVKEKLAKISETAKPMRRALLRQAKKLKDDVLGAVGIKKDAAKLFGNQLAGVKEHLEQQLTTAGLKGDAVGDAVNLALSRMKSEKRDRASEVLGKTIEALQEAKEKVDSGATPKINVKELGSEMQLDMNLSSEDINKLNEAESPQEIQVAMNDIMDDKIEEAKLRDESISGDGIIDLSVRPEPILPIKDPKQIVNAQKTAESLVKTLKQTKAHEQKIEDVKRQAVYASRGKGGMDSDIEEMRIYAVQVEHQDLLDMGIDEQDIYQAASNLQETAASQAKEFNLYKLLAKHWDDEDGGKVKPHIARGAVSTLTGMTAKFATGLGVPNLQNLMNLCGPEMTTYAVASYLHDIAEKGKTTIFNPETKKKEKFTLQNFDQMVNSIVEWNRFNQSDAEERALGKIAEIQDAQNILREQMSQGEIAVTDEAIDRLKAAGLTPKNVIKIETEGLKNRMAALQLDNRYLNDQEKIVGETLGGLQTAAGFLYALKQVRRGREATTALRDMTMHVGGQGMSEEAQMKLARDKLRSIGIKGPKKAGVEIQTGADGVTLKLRAEVLIPHMDRWVRDAQKATRLQEIKEDTSQIDPKTGDWVDKPLSAGGLGTSQEILPQLKSGIKLRGNQATDIRVLMHGGGGVITRSTAAGKTLTGMGYLAARIDQDLKGDGRGYRGVVIVPGSKVSEWVSEGEKFLDGEKIGVIAWKPKTRKVKKEGKMVDEPVKDASGNTVFIPPKIPAKGEGRPFIVEVPEHLGKGQIDSYLKATKHLTHAIFVMNHQAAAENNEYLERQMGGSGKPPNGIVIDEPQMLLGLRGRQRMNIGKRIFEIPSTHKVALTATPAKKSLKEAYKLVQWSAQRPMVDEKGAPVYRETTGQDGLPTGRMRPVYEKEAGKQIGKRQQLSKPFIPYEIFQHLESGGTSAQRDILNDVVMQELGPYMSGDEFKKVSFKINHHEVKLDRSESQRSNQRQIEEAQERIFKKHEEKARKGGTITTEDGRRFKYPKVAADDVGARKAVMRRARDEAMTEIGNLHRMNIDGVDADVPKIQSMVNNLVAEIKGGTRIRHEGGKEKKEKISGKKRKHIIVVSSPQQAAAVQAALDQAGIKHLNMATSMRDAGNPEIMTKDVKEGGRLQDKVVVQRRDEWKNDADRIDDKTGAYVRGENKIPVMIIDKDTAAGHNLQEADTMHVVGAPDDAATLLQAHGRAARDPKLSDNLDIYTYRHRDSPFEHAHWDTLHKQMELLRTTAPAAVRDVQFSAEKRREQEQAKRVAQQKTAELETKGKKKPVRKGFDLFVTV